MLPKVSPLRMLRLCLKELRESLRDRRTIVTLVLMPLLVYPLLSLILNRVLLTSMSGSSESSVSFGIGKEMTDSKMPGILVLGYTLLQDREISPVFTEDIVQDRDDHSATDAELKSQALPRPRIVPLKDDGRVALRAGAVDLVITRKSPATEDNDTSSERPRRRSGRRALEAWLQQYAETEHAPTEFDPTAMLTLIGKYEVRYRQGDQQSERALQMLERCLAAVNNEASRGIIGREYAAPFRLLATPVTMKSNYADLLATMVPLVLVLMTMAGAVYPAIDLTAGERERGTMEALIVSPTPSWILLLAKYSAVVTVALLTALANLGAMTITLWVSGIGKLVFGNDVLSVAVIGTVLALLVLFTMFFAALLLAITSFAKSFKEAQAYLIPLMLLALTPGVMSLLPGIKFSGLLATVPLVNIVLLARQVLVGDAQWNTAMIAVICNCLYALAALAVAGRLFGSDASMHGSQGSWRDLAMRPSQVKPFPSVDQMALTMAAMFPLYFVASSMLGVASEELATRLWLSAGVSFVLILGVPIFVAFYRRIELVSTFRLQVGSIGRWLVWIPASILVACSAWMVAHEIIIGGMALGIGTISTESFERVAEFRDQLAQLPLWMVLIVFAVTPAICEEFLFRGFVLSSLHKYSAFGAIVTSAILFGLMHVLTSNMLAVERFFPSTFMGLILATVAVRTGSIWPGILLHALHNGLLLTVSHYQEELKSLELFVSEGNHLPVAWLAVGGPTLIVGLALFWLAARIPHANDSQSQS